MVCVCCCFFDGWIPGQFEMCLFFLDLNKATNDLTVQEAALHLHPVPAPVNVYHRPQCGKSPESCCASGGESEKTEIIPSLPLPHTHTHTSLEFGSVCHFHFSRNKEEGEEEEGEGEEGKKEGNELQSDDAERISGSVK